MVGLSKIVTLLVTVMAVLCLAGFTAPALAQTYGDKGMPTTSNVGMGKGMPSTANMGANMGLGKGMGKGGYGGGYGGYGMDMGLYGGYGLGTFGCPGGFCGYGWC